MSDLEKMLRAVFSGTDARVYAIDEDGVTEITLRPQPETLAERYPKWRLLNLDSFSEVLIGQTITDSIGQDWTINGGAPPHKPNSTGRVYVRLNDYDGEGLGEREFFPSVFGLKWYHISEVKECPLCTGLGHVYGKPCPKCGGAR